MTRVRRSLRCLVLIWLGVQLAAVSLIVPGYCCASETQHAAPTPAEHACHETPPPPADCAMRGDCSGPGTAIVSLLSNYGILPLTIADRSAFTGVPLAVPNAERAVALQHPPDAPPPRS